MISLSVAMMAHPKRRDAAQQILTELGQEIPIVWDEINNRWDTGRRSMLAYDPGCTHHLVIQDDVIVCRDLIAGVRRALEYVPDDAPLCGYVGRVRPQKEATFRAAQEAFRVGASFVTMHTLNWGPLIVVPTGCIPEMISYCDPLPVPNYDKRLSRYWELSRKVRVWYAWPNLVDHRDGPSLVPGRIGTDRSQNKSCRVAHNFLGEDRSALEVDWSGPVVHAGIASPIRRNPDLRTYRNVRTGQLASVPELSSRVGRYENGRDWERV